MAIVESHIAPYIKFAASSLYLIWWKACVISFVQRLLALALWCYSADIALELPIVSVTGTSCALHMRTSSVCPLNMLLTELSQAYNCALLTIDDGTFLWSWSHLHLPSRVFLHSREAQGICPNIQCHNLSHTNEGPKLDDDIDGHDFFKLYV